MANSQYWEDIKDLFKSKKRLKEEEAQEVGAAVKKEESILEQLKKLEAEYAQSVKKETPDFDAMFPTINLDRVSYGVDSDEEIAEKADRNAAAKYADKISDINADSLDKAKSLAAEKDEAAEKKKATLSEIDGLYKSLIERAQNDSIKKGVQRSSIIDNAYKDIADYKHAVESGAAADYEKTAASIDGALASLENDRKTALNDINLKKAVEITENIQKLQSEKESLLAKQLKENNAIEKQESELNAKLLKKKDDYIADYNENEIKQREQQDAYEAENGYSGEKLSNYAERYNLALEFYMSLDPDVAPKALEASANMKYYLGNFYDKLKGVLDDRASSRTVKYL